MRPRQEQRQRLTVRGVGMGRGGTAEAARAVPVTCGTFVQTQLGQTVPTAPPGWPPLVDLGLDWRPTMRG